MGIFVSDVQAGRVSGVLDGQAKEQGLEAHFGVNLLSFAGRFLLKMVNSLVKIFVVLD